MTAFYSQNTAPSIKPDGSLAGLHGSKNDKCRRQRCMAAKSDLALRSEPAQRIVISPWNQECRLRKIVFRRNSLHLAFRQPLFQEAYGGGIPRKHLIGECINLKNWNIH